MSRSLIRHWLTALLSGLLVFVILEVAAWYHVRGRFKLCPHQFVSRFYVLGALRSQIEDYRKSHGTLPPTLTEIPDVHTELNLPGMPLLDSWGNPVQYRPVGETYELFSYGRDGRPGGVGLDADLYADERNRDLARPTLGQYFLTQDRDEVRWAGFVGTGLLAAGLVVCFTLLTLRGTLQTRTLPGAQLTVWHYARFGLVVFVFSSLVGLALLPLQLAYGH